MVSIGAVVVDQVQRTDDGGDPGLYILCLSRPSFGFTGVYVVPDQCHYSSFLSPLPIISEDLVSSDFKGLSF
jgi:hypothetical protein